MPLFTIDDTVTCKQYMAEAAHFYASASLPDEITRNIEFRMERGDPAIAHTLIALVAKFAKRLVSSEETLREVVSEKFKKVELSYEVPKRPVDHLFAFLSHYIPWFDQFIQYRVAVVTDVAKHQEIKTTVHEHYHIIPFEGQARDLRWHFMAWDGDHYDGSPTEWNDLKAIRDYLDKNGISIEYGNILWEAGLQRLYQQYRMNKHKELLKN